MNTVKNLNERSTFYASDSLIEELKEKMKEGDTVINFAFTDYGGTFFDKVCIEFFAENHSDSIVFENTGWSGQNAFLFGPVADKFLETSENYILGFDGLENYYYEKQNETERDSFEYFLSDLSGYEIAENALDALCSEKSGHYSITTQGVDFCSSELIEYCEKNGLISKIEDLD